jgi:hypothetical protein
MESEKDALRRVLEEIRDDQRKLLAQNEQLLDITRGELEIVKRQHDRVSKIQDRAEAIQSRSEGLVGVARKAFYVIIPVLIALLGYVSWLLFRLMR